MKLNWVGVKLNGGSGEVERVRGEVERGELEHGLQLQPVQLHLIVLKCLLHNTYNDFFISEW